MLPLDLGTFLRRRTPPATTTDALLREAIRAYESGDLATASRRYTAAARRLLALGRTDEALQATRCAAVCADQLAQDVAQGAQEVGR